MPEGRVQTHAERRSAGDAAHGIVAALPFAAAALVLLGTLAAPIRFTPRPGVQGIVSAPVLAGYPAQQELFWLGAALLLGGLLSWLLARVLGARARPQWEMGLIEALAVSALLAALWLPRATSPVLALAAAAAALALSRRRPRPAPASPAATSAAAGAQRSGASARLRACLAVGLALLLTPLLWARLHAVWIGAPDALFVQDGWTFQAEVGQHLTWSDAILRGQLPGRDFYCLYGPLHPLGAVATWSLLGRSIAAWDLYTALTYACGAAAALALALWHLRRAWLALALPFLVLPLGLRYGFGLLALLLLSQALVAGTLRAYLLAGVAGAGSLLFSQEFGAAFLLCALAALLLRFEAKPALGFAAGLGLGLAPCLLWLASGGALLPMLRDLAEYPSLVAAGFGKLPFPSLRRGIPLHPVRFDLDATRLLRLAYAVGAIPVAALLVILRFDRIEARRPLASARALRARLLAEPRRLALALLALYGLLGFRSAMGRTAFAHVVAAAPAAAILLCVGADRALDLALRTPGRRALGLWRLACLAGVAWLGAFLAVSAPRALRALEETGAILRRPAAGVRRTPRAATALPVVEWLRAHAQPSDPLYFLPNHAAYYYLLERPMPTRYALSHQMVTDAHRAEALAALEAHPPRFVIWHARALKLDGIAHETYIGAAIMDWIHANYVRVTRIGSAEILARREDVAQPEP